MLLIGGWLLEIGFRVEGLGFRCPSGLYAARKVLQQQQNLLLDIVRSILPVGNILLDWALRALNPRCLELAKVLDYCA